MTNEQVRKLMSELARHGQVGRAALCSAMDRKTARKYREVGKLPSELKEVRSYRTRKDPFERDWSYVKGLLEVTPELEAKTIFEHLGERSPGRYAEGQLRTLQRRVRRWLAQEGPPKEVFFGQEHVPGEALQTDYTGANELEITIQGEPFEHLLGNSVLPYSNWQSVIVCRSESLLSIRRSVQTALFRLRHVPEYHQTDNSTAATHGARSEEGNFVGWEEGSRQGRLFNENYLELMRHYGLKPRTTGIGKKEQNGDVESANGALKRRLNQHLLLRGSRDFESVEAYERWIGEVIERVNRLLRAEKLAEETAVMKLLGVARLPEYSKEDLKVTRYSTVRVKSNTYSVPSRLIGEKVVVRVYEDRIAVYHDGTPQFTTERLLGVNHRRIDYRHVIDSLVEKPGAFPRYRYREDFFPCVVFRRAHDALHEALSVWQADLEYLRVLQLAARTLETVVEQALARLLAEGTLPRFSVVEELTVPSRPEVPAQETLEVDLGSYDQLLEGMTAEEVVA